MSDPIFSWYKFEKHIESLASGLGWIGGQVTISGHKIKVHQAKEVADHVYNNLPNDKRIWGATLSDIRICLERVPWIPQKRV